MGCSCKIHTRFQRQERILNHSLKIVVCISSWKVIVRKCWVKTCYFINFTYYFLFFNGTTKNLNCIWDLMIYFWTVPILRDKIQLLRLEPSKVRFHCSSSLSVMVHCEIIKNCTPSKLFQAASFPHGYWKPVLWFDKLVKAEI